MMTQHAQVRCRQRGVTDETLMTVLEEADVETNLAGNCRMHRVSQRTARVRGLAPKLSRIGVVLSDDSQKIVTVIHFSGHRQWRYTRGK